jgi:hypothetical protein
VGAHIINTLWVTERLEDSLDKGKFLNNLVTSSDDQILQESNGFREESFWLFASIIEERMPLGFFSLNQVHAGGVLTDIFNFILMTMSASLKDGSGE